MIYNRSNRFLGGVGGILASDSLGALQRIVRSLGDIDIFAMFLSKNQDDIVRIILSKSFRIM